MIGTDVRRWTRGRRVTRGTGTNVSGDMGLSAAVVLAGMVAARDRGVAIRPDGEQLVVWLFRTEGRSLVRLARLFVDDRDAAEDLVQEAFIRLARNAERIEHRDRAPAYLRSIVLNLARDHNRRGLVSLRHQLPAGHEVDAAYDAELDERLVQDEEQMQVLDAVRALSIRQRDCITLRYFEELGIEEIATTLAISVNSVKTHLQRGMRALESALGGQAVGQTGVESDGTWR
jgi:RNA polymerase sigma factor (sigma-70 family)